MNVGYYFHLPASFNSDGTANVPAWHGDIISGLAEVCGTITYFAPHVARTSLEDRTIGPPRIRPVNVGTRRRAPEVSLHPSPTLRSIESRIDELDALLVRGPTALLPHLTRYESRVPVVALIMADYANWRPDKSQPRWRSAFIKGWVAFYNRQQDRALRDLPVLAVGRSLAGKLASRGLSVEEIFPSTIRQAEVVSMPEASQWRWDDMAGRSRPVRLLYAGRLVEEKGIFDAMSATQELLRRGWRIRLDLVGWWVDEEVERQMHEEAFARGVADAVRWVGYVPSGPELSKLYRNADIYVHATRNEASVSQSLNEAMALHVPTVTTRIPENEAELTDGRETVLVDPRSPIALADGIERLLRDPGFAAAIARGGWEWARTRTLERSCAMIADYIRQCVDERSKA